MANNRVFYACEAVGISNDGGDSTAAVEIRGLQSVGINTTFNLTQVFEIGMLGLYQNIEGVADVEVTLEKVIDGHPSIWHLASGGPAYSPNTLIGRSSKKCSVYLGIYPDTSETAQGGTPETGGVCTVSGAFVSQVSYKIGVDGNGTESVTLVANEKAWSSTYSVGGSFPDGLTATGVPLAVSGVAQRQHLVMGNNSFFPNSIKGIASKLNATGAGGAHAVSFQSASVSCSMGREQILELGRKTPYFRFVKFPVEVTSDFEIIAKTGDGVDVGESAAALSNEEIKLVFSQGLTIDLGTKNKLASVNFTGGGAGGDNATISYSYKTYNHFVVTQS
jgi:hypothetical protein